MTDLASGSRAKLIIEVGQVFRVSTAGTATLTPAYGAPEGDIVVAAGYKDLGPYSVPAKFLLLANSGPASYSLLRRQSAELDPVTSGFTQEGVAAVKAVGEGLSLSAFAADFANAPIVADYASGVSLATAVVRTVGSGNALPPYLGARVIEMVHNATNSQADITVSINKETFTTLAFEVDHSGTMPQVLTLYVSESGGSFTAGTYAQLTFVAWPGLHVYAFNRGAFQPNGSHDVAAPGTYTLIRIKEQTDTQGNAGTFLYPPITGQGAYIGPLKMVPPGKAVVMFHTDDAHDDHFVETSGATFAGLFSEAGVKATCNVTTEMVGTTGKMTWAQLRALQNGYGWCIAQQGDKDAVSDGTNPQQGMRAYRFFDAAATSLANRFKSDNTLITDAAVVTGLIATDLRTARAKLRANGLTSGISHASIPQGGYDDRVEAAFTSAGSFKTVRGVVIPGPGQRYVCTVPMIGHNCEGLLPIMGGVYNSVVPRGPVINLPGALTLENDAVGAFGSGALGDPKAYLDEAVRCGGVIGFYAHQLLSTATVARIRATLKYAKELEAQGKLIISTPDALFGA